MERQAAVRIESDVSRGSRVAVSDRGIGIAPDKLESIFQPFHTSKAEGMGMGLSVSKSIIEAHGGKLWAENNIDRGAVFYFTLPIGENQ